MTRPKKLATMSINSRFTVIFIGAQVFREGVLGAVPFRDFGPVAYDENWQERTGVRSDLALLPADCKGIYTIAGGTLLNSFNQEGFAIRLARSRGGTGWGLLPMQST